MCISELPMAMNKGWAVSTVSLPVSRTWCQQKKKQVKTSFLCIQGTKDCSKLLRKES